MEAIVLAGGLGTRLHTRVADRPKPMALIAGRPFLAILLDYLAGQGIGRVILSVGYGRDKIIDLFGDRYGRLDLAYAIEETPLGTGGAIAHALPHVSGELAWVLNGDTFLELDYRAMHAAFVGASPRPLMAMALRRVPDASRYGAVAAADGLVAGFLPAGAPTGGLINSGVYLVAPTLFPEGMPAVFSFERDFLPAACRRSRIQAFETNGWFIDIGVPEDFDRAQVELPPRVASSAEVAGDQRAERVGDRQG
jgi:D-glycero-alpha-D-manno-heptose 1-phosphate guanylyltransferase